MRRIAFEKTVLKEVGIKKRWAAQIGVLPFLITIAIAVAGFVGISEVPEGEEFIKKEDYFELAATIIAIGGAAVAYEQWTETKRDSSLDKYYERLNLTNEGFYRWDKTREMFPHFWETEDNTPYEWVMYVYLELDNLEYAVTKYQNGSMEPEIVFRSLVTFISRCQSKTFLKLAESFVEKSIGYSPTTKAVVIKIANPCNICDPQVESWLYQQLEPGKVGALIS